MPPLGMPSSFRRISHALNSTAVGTAESQMIETRPVLVERLSAVQIRELSETDDCVARKPSDTLERT